MHAYITLIRIIQIYIYIYTMHCTNIILPNLDTRLMVSRVGTSQSQTLYVSSGTLFYRVERMKNKLGLD